MERAKMLNEPQIQRMLDKLTQLEHTLEPYIFQKQAVLSMKAFPTRQEFYAPPSEELYRPVSAGDTWGGERSYCWFKGEYTVPEELAGKPLYLMPRLGGYEILLFVDGKPFGTYAYKICATGHGNHYCDLIRQNPAAGETIRIDLEAYAGTFVPGCFPFEEPNNTNFDYTYEQVEVCTKNQDIADFLFDLHVLNQLAACMDPYSFRRADVINCLTQVHQTVYYSPEHADESVWREALRQARAIMAPCLAAKNAESAPKCGLIGHSHMDTAWLWDISQTIKKCARTYSNQLSLMEQYPEYTFVQSSAYHSEMIRRHYPELFERIKEMVRAGRYEPNGGVYVECDCNITSGESMVRQFLWGQRFTREHFGYTADSFWLPDTFGYSAAIPQIMKGAGVDYFLTTKLSWNDTNTFPYETFLWEGIDGTEVLVHFNCTHNWPDPDALIGRTEGRGKVNSLQQKTVADERLISYGFGDGGGGPQFEMIEIARRCKDLDGCPKSEHTTVSAFMHKLEQDMVSPNRYAGELYLELHRGTLTNQHAIKRNNRKAEQAIHNAEFITVADAVLSQKEALADELHPLVETLLVNQFHDILPGTCIQSAHELSVKETSAVIEQADAITRSLVSGGNAGEWAAINTLSFPYDDLLLLPAEEGWVDTSLPQQEYTGMDGKRQVAVAGLPLPPYSSTRLAMGGHPAAAESPFRYENRRLTTPFAEIQFNEKGYMSSFIDRRNGRELVDGLPFNTFLLAEDVPSAWDNWDIDADLPMKFSDAAVLLEEEVVADGCVEFRFRRRYRLTSKSSIRQDMVFYAHTPRVDFETEIDWHDKRRFLKTAFDTSILSRTARHEIQFGYACKPTTRNNSTEQAMFEVVNHKYTDLSETRYGCAILNDCKYGISAEGGRLRLSLHKGGIRPDPRGDEGLHLCAYSFLPHDGAFSAESVIRPAYAFNYRPFLVQGGLSFDSLALVDASNVILETIKPCEDGGRAFIARLYEAEGTYVSTPVRFGFHAKKAALTNLLEEEQEVLSLTDDQVELSFHPFEIKTLRIEY